jgi:hypothetical protein
VVLDGSHSPAARVLASGWAGGGPVASPAQWVNIEGFALSESPVFVAADPGTCEECIIPICTDAELPPPHVPVVVLHGTPQTVALLGCPPYPSHRIGHPGWSITRDLDQRAIAAGVPTGHAAMLRWLTGAIIAGKGSTPTGDVETVIGQPATSFEAFA